jgi:undecaprenyl pyrophosphate phosphatase UppP
MKRCYECGTINTDEANVCENCYQPIERPVTRGWVRYAGIGFMVAFLAAPVLWLLTFVFGSGVYPFTSWGLVLGVIALLVGFVTYRIKT